MKESKKKKYNDHYYKYLAKEKYRNRLNGFLFKLWKIVYKISCLLPVDQKAILFVANKDFSVPPEFESLRNLAKEKGYTTRFILKTPNSSDIIYENEWRKIKNELKFQVRYATSKCTFLCDYFLPAYANEPRKGTKLVQIWHGCGAFKKWGYSTKDSDWGLQSDFFEKYNIHKTYTHIITSSEEVNEIYAEAFDSPLSKIKALGVPRTDVFFDENFVSVQKEKLLQKYPELSGKKLVLWAPSYRGNDLRASHNDLAIDFAKLKNIIGEDYALLIKLHPHIAKRISKDELNVTDEGFVYDISKEFQISSALCFADMVISDYSSLIFEYSLLERPMIFYAYDLEIYENDRSFYYDYESFVPGEIVRTTEELGYAILNSEKNFDKQMVTAFKNRFMSSCDGKATERIFDLGID